MKSVFVVGARGIPNAEGGVEKNAERLFPRIVKRGWQVTLAGLDTYIDSSSYRGIKLLAFPAPEMLKTDKLLYYILALLAALRLRPDIVHLSGLGSALLLWAYRLIGCKTVVRYSSADYLLSKWGLLGRLGFLLSERQLQKADAIIAVTPALVFRLRERGITKNIHMIPNALDCPADFSERPPVTLPDKYVLSVGRVTGQKNYHRLIGAFREWEGKPNGLKLVIVGGLDDACYLERLSHLLSEEIVLTGRLDRTALGTIYHHAQAYICCSIHEGNSNSVLEAISFRCPLLLSDISENRDFRVPVRHYFDPFGAKSIQRAIEGCLSDRNRYIVSRSQFPDWDQIADRTDSVYRSLFVEQPVSRAAG